MYYPWPINQNTPPASLLFPTTHGSPEYDSLCACATAVANRVDLVYDPVTTLTKKLSTSLVRTALPFLSDPLTHTHKRQFCIRRLSIFPGFSVCVCVCVCVCVFV